MQSGDMRNLSWNTIKKKFLSCHYRVQMIRKVKSDRSPLSPENSPGYWKSTPDPKKEKTRVTCCHIFRFNSRSDAYFLVKWQVYRMRK